MLLEFKVKNYKSFLEETTFSMMAAPKQTGLDYSVFCQTVNKKKLKGLCSSVIYGPNAAGKTNIIAAMDTLRKIILRGNIRNFEENVAKNQADSPLELIPNKDLTKAEPVIFSIDFLEGELWFQYKLFLDLGVFLDGDYEWKVLDEVLSVNEKLLFERKGCKLWVDFKTLYVVDPEFAEHPVQNSEDLIGVAEKSIKEEELFLTNGFKLIFSPKVAGRVQTWFSERFMVFCQTDAAQLAKRFADPQKKTVYVNKTMNRAAKLFGINSNAIGYLVTEDAKTHLCSLFTNKDETVAVAAETFESYGTVRFVNVFPLVLRAILTGGVLVMDEFDASIHPMALMNIINIFHNDEINIHHAQLIFNTHNPVFLNANLFRRDEIKFVERDDKSFHSTLYSLSDFGTEGSSGVRKGEDYMKNYFVSRYGAIKEIDFTPVFEELLASEGEKKYGE